ncbi:YbaB/EbfC family nucleoid-associated protein [Nocardioides litoris]|uniref:YbaB/EbfC family nucleoid-associated protein n=1 Tax=Nocardioides litoris TaxID=1926648 RepID=UPI0011224AD1|nr:YbaB/EbfC family nucleoid-associated protein [Nocardioides litoris]
MTDNPFGGAGGFDMNSLLEQAQAMQAQLVEAQQQLADMVVEGTAAGVTVKVAGTGELVGVEIGVGVVDGGDPESLTDLGDVIVAAYRDAKANADAAAAGALGPLAGGGGLPGMPDLGGGAAPGKLGF